MANLSFDWFFRPHLADEDLPLSAEIRFAEALAELPAIERSALALSEIGGLGTDEIAERLGTDVAVVRKLLVRARQTVRTTIDVRGRRGLSALIPFQSWWSSGSTAPTLRAAGAVAAAVIGTGVAIGGAAADPPRPALISPDPPVVRSLDSPQERRVSAASADSAVEMAVAETRKQTEEASGPAALRPEDDRYGDIGQRPGHTAAEQPYAPARRGNEPEIGARTAPPTAPEPGTESVLPKPPLDEPPPPPPPLPFPAPYSVPVPGPVPVPAIPPAPVPLPPVESPVAPVQPPPTAPVPAIPFPAPLPPVPPLP